MANTESSKPHITFIYKNFCDYNNEFNKFKQYINNPNFLNGEYDTLYDLPFKYINILNHLETLQDAGIQIKSIVDPGCAYSSLSAYIAKKYNVSNAYLFDFANVSGKSILQEQQQIFNMNSVNTKIYFYGGDYYSNVDNIPDDSIDLVIDGCSITHFCGNKGGNQSWNAFCKTIYPKLKSNGYIIISTDVKDYQGINNQGINNQENNKNTNETITGATEEFLYPLDIINIFKNNRFNLVGNPILSNDRIVLSNLYPLRVASLLFTKI